MNERYYKTKNFLRLPVYESDFISAPSQRKANKLPAKTNALADMSLRWVHIIFCFLLICTVQQILSEGCEGEASGVLTQLHKQDRIVAELRLCKGPTH